MVMPAEELTADMEKAFANATVLSNSEVAVLLDRVRRTRADEQGAAPEQAQLPPLVEKTQEYVEDFNIGKNVDAIQNLRSHLEAFGFAPYEYGVIANLMPETAEECMALLPSLKDEGQEVPRFTKEQLQEVLDTALSYRDFQ